jgi:hypothetical protein
MTRTQGLRGAAGSEAFQKEIRQTGFAGKL